MTSNQTRPVPDFARGCDEGTGRPATWTVELPPGLPLLNANARVHWSRRSRRTRDLRTAAWAAARNARVPALGRIHVVAEYRPPDKRRRDVHNLFPAAKAAIDGLVDAGVIEDDSDEFLTGPDMRVGDPVKGGQLILHIWGVA